MGMGWIVVILLVIGAIYLISNPEKVPSIDFTKITKPIKDIQNLTVMNETPSSTITKTEDTKITAK